MATPNPPRSTMENPKMLTAIPGASIKSPMRRVLGELAPNVHGTPAKSQHAISETTKIMGNLSPVKAAGPFTRIDQSPSKLVLEMNSTFAGKKRSFEEVGGVMGRESGSTTRPSGHSAIGQTRNAFSAQRPRVPSATTRFLELPSDASSTDEDIPGHINEAASQHTVASKDSFGSIFDFNKAMEIPSTDDMLPDTTRGVTRTQVEKLRLYLRMAMYKVSTNQILTPIDQIQVPSHQILRHRTLSQSSIETQLEEDTDPLPTIEMERPLRRQTEPPSIVVSPSKPSSPRQRAGSLHLLPAPILLPTKYSSRFITSPAAAPSPPLISPGRAAHNLLSISEGTVQIEGRTPIATRRARERGDGEDEIAHDAAAGDFDVGNPKGNEVAGTAASRLLDLMKS